MILSLQSVILSLSKDQLPASSRVLGKVCAFRKLILRHCLRDSANNILHHFCRAPKAQPQDDGGCNAAFYFEFV